MNNTPGYFLITFVGLLVCGMCDELSQGVWGPWQYCNSTDCTPDSRIRTKIPIPKHSLVQTRACRQRRDRWITVLQASSGIGRSIYDLWHGPSSTKEWSGDLNMPYQKSDSHYKSPLVEQWQALKIKQVKLKMYDYGREVATVNFNGTHSTKMSWFSLDTTINSSWMDFPAGIGPPGTSGRIVSIKGYDIPGHSRRFYINRNFGGCRNDAGWLMVADGEGSICPKDAIRPWPVLLYAKHHTVGQYADVTGNFGQADTMVIEILI